MSDTRQKPGIQLDDIEPTLDATGGSVKKRAIKFNSKTKPSMEKKQNPKLQQKKPKLQKEFNHKVQSKKNRF